MIGGPSPCNAMNHALLNHRSEVFVDDNIESVEKRCFVLLCGKQSSDPFIQIDVGINAFDEAHIKKNLQLNLLLDQVVIEYNSEILKSLTGLALDYKIASFFGDLYPAPKPNKINKKKNLWRMIELQAPLFNIKKQLLKRSMEGNLDKAIATYHSNFQRSIEEKKTDVQKQKEMKDKQVKTIQQIRKLDRGLADFNFDVAICMKKVYLGLAGEKEDILTSSSTMLEVAVENQNISLIKKDIRCHANVCGISVTSLSSFEMIFAFVN